MYSKVRMVYMKDNETMRTIVDPNSRMKRKQFDRKVNGFK